ncbi:uncharacterized protein LOC115458336 [Microcaecilia unicolor]|uniref:Uncharacterized protein LOC115458336 n=1 Tax=Microcaecilia unicolor TaxID=1415580 RepID=A0A6P7X0L4_9AMPH|nr:uncharacterized protein LOC115458336 [Microcaecilia unicolor]
MLRLEKKMSLKVLHTLSGISLLVLISNLEVSAQHPRFDVFQPESVSAVVGESVTLPCSFSYPRDFGPIRNVNVYWRINTFHGDFIYSHTEESTRQDYRGRIFLDGDPLRENTASIRITDLRETDSERYFCRVKVIGSGGRTEQWQNFSGTALRVSVSARDPRCQVFQSRLLSAGVGKSIVLRCDFNCSQEIEPLEDAKVYWRINSSRGNFIYNHSEGFTRQDFRGRISLVGDPQSEKIASIRIRDLKIRDSNSYFCRVHLTGNDGRTEQLQTDKGVKLRVSAAGMATTMAPNVTMEREAKDTWQLHRTDVIILAAVTSVFKLGICLMAGFCFRWHIGGKPAAPLIPPGLRQVSGHGGE